MRKPLVSIVVPTYNSARYLGRMIDSVGDQTVEDWELIIVDGQSADGTRALIDDYRPRLLDRLVFIEQPNQGCNAARNTGIDAAHGRFIAFLDSDDEFLPGKLERQLDLFERCPELGLAYSDFSYVDLDGQPHESMFDDRRSLARKVPSTEVAPGMHVCDENLIEYLIQDYFIATIVGMVRREILSDDIRFHTENWYGFCEWMFYLEIVRRCRAGYVDEPLSRCHFVDGSITRTSRIRNSLDHRDLLRTMESRFADCSPTVRHAVRKQLAATCRQLGMHAYKSAEYAPAIRYFREALDGRFDILTTVHLCQSAARWLTRLGRPGHEPRLRLETQQTP